MHLPKGIRRLCLHLLLFAAYVGAARLGLSFASINPSATAIWPPTGIAIAAILLWGRACWPAIFAGAFVANILTAGSVMTSLGVATGNTLEGVAGAYMIARFAGGRAAFGRAPAFFRFVLAGLIAPFISATIGVSVLSLGGYALWTDYGSIWLTWWLGDVSGVLLVVPLFMLWTDAQSEAWPLERYLEAALLLGSVAGSAFLVFDDWFLAPRNLPLEFFTLPFLLWTAFRFGPRETATAMAILSAIATWATLRGSGPFGALGTQGPLVLQTFMVTAAITAMFTAALVVERRRVEAERLRLLQAEQAARREAEAANAAKDRFVAMLGHELRNPLGAIVTAVHVIERDPTREHRQTRATEIIRRQVTHLTRLVDDLLDLGRLTADKLTLERVPINLAELATAAHAALDGADRTSRIELHCEPVWVDGDATRLSQVVMNLLTNAIKFTPRGGTIRLTTDRSDGQARLVVVDSGIGIEPLLLPRIFDLFRQGNDETENTHHGLGIGLTLVKSLVELHGGTVEAASGGRNLGSAFTIRLPAIAAPEAVASGVSESATVPPRQVTRRVLIVEDEADLRAILRAALEGAGHEVFEAASGPDAVEAMERYRPHAAFVDVGLPQFDGYEVARRVRRMPAGEQVFLVALTGYGHPDGRDRAEAAGFNLHLLKPIDPFRLNELLVAGGQPNGASQ